MTTCTWKSPARLHPPRRAVKIAELAEDYRSLAKVADAAARSRHAGRSAEEERRAAKGPGFTPQQLLALLTYCYARQIYRSSVIAWLLRHDQELIRLCPDGLPNAEQIQRFRSENREVLRSCLAAALRFLLEKKIAAGVLTRISETQTSEEAGRRIINAMFVDSTGPDGGTPSGGRADSCYLFANRTGRGH